MELNLFAEDEVAREPPSPHDPGRSPSRRWFKRSGHDVPAQAPNLSGIDITHAWMEVSDDPSIQWLRSFLAQYRTLHEPGRRSAGLQASTGRVMDLVCPEEAQPCKDFMKDFLFRLREQKEQESQSGSFQEKRQSGKTKPTAPKEERLCNKRQERKSFSETAGSTESPDVAAAVARAKRRASEEKRRQAKADEAAAKALQQEVRTRTSQRPFRCGNAGLRRLEFLFLFVCGGLSCYQNGTSTRQKTFINETKKKRGKLGREGRRKD
ncbi:unnamed protein product [Durusdinium trenchii]|uniref:Uncharacterized protein n=1 Tax=Durusdinium trenchii TaxID=1381693 RepID=A0ABP0L3U8_9DINO